MSSRAGYMKIWLLRVAIITLFVLIQQSQTDAQTITGVSGTITDGSTVTVTGSSFGTHTDFGGSAPFLNAAWTQFTTALDGGNLARSNQVTTAVQWSLQTAGNRGEPGGRFARKRNDQLAAEPRLGALSHVANNSGSRFYTSFWFKTAAANVMTGGKVYRQYFNGFDVFFSSGSALSDEQGDLTGYSNHGSATTIYGSTRGVAFDPVQWRRVEFLVCLNGCASTFGSDDYVEARINGVRYNRRGSGLPSNHMDVEGSMSNERENWVSAPSGAANGHTIDIGMMINNDAEDAGNPLLSYYDFDDVFINYGFQRLLLSTASTCATISQAEIQPATAWAPGSISFNVNRGAFAPNASLYLYVFNENNTCNTNGYPVQLGGSGTTTLTTPQNLRIVPGFAALLPVFFAIKRRRRSDSQ